MAFPCFVIRSTFDCAEVVDKATLEALGNDMDDRTRYEAVKSRLRAMGEGTSKQVHDSMEPSPYSVREVENTLDEMVIHEHDEFEKLANVYRWKKHYRFRTR
jgi:hypothetical protein